MMKNQTTMFYLTGSCLGLLYVRTPFSVWISQLFTALDCNSIGHNQGRVNGRVVVEVGALAVLYTQRAANRMQINQ